ncbi:hypothetical protein Tco_0864892 [Tanacetum coccineum]
MSHSEMLIPNAFLTAEIRETNDFKEYKTVFMKVDVLMNQLQLVASTQGTHRITPSAHRSPTVSASPPVSKKRKQTARESSSPQQSLKITIKQKQTVEKTDDDFKDRIEPRSHKDNPEVVVDDDDKEIEKQDDEMGSLEIRNEETQTTIPTPLSSPRKISDNENFLGIDGYCFQSNYFNIQTFPSQEKDFQEILSSFRSTSHDVQASRNLQDRADDIALWEALRHKFEKSSTSNTSCREDDFHSHHDEHQDDDSPPDGEKRVKRSKTTKRSKSARGSSSKHSRKDSTTYGSLKQQVNIKNGYYIGMKENVVNEDEMISEDVTPELIVEFQNVDKRVPTIFDHARMKATLRDSLSNMSRNAEEYAYHLEQLTNFMESQIYGNTEKKKYILSLHKIHAEEFPEPDLEEKLNRWVQKEFKTFNEDARLSIQHWKDLWHKRVYKQNQKKVRKNPEDYYSNHMITKVVRIVTDQPHGLDFMEQILVIRANDKLDSFSEADFKYLNKNDIEYLYYQKLCDLGEEHAPYTIVDEPQMGLIYLNSKDEKRVMYLEEIVKFCDATLEKVLNEVKLIMFESFTIIDGDDITKDVVIGMKFCKKYASCQMTIKKFALGDKCERIMEDE